MKLTITPESPAEEKALAGKSIAFAGVQAFGLAGTGSLGSVRYTYGPRRAVADHIVGLLEQVRMEHSVECNLQSARGMVAAYAELTSRPPAPEPPKKRKAPKKKRK